MLGTSVLAAWFCSCLALPFDGLLNGFGAQLASRATEGRAHPQRRHPRERWKGFSQEMRGTSFEIIGLAIQPDDFPFPLWAYLMDNLL